jgi:GNAT superfamily N-acetyltransferase
MDYRLATVDDIPQLARMRWDFRAEAGEEPIEGADAFERRYAAFARQALESRAWAYWVAVDGGRIVSHAAVNVVRGVPRPSRKSDQWGYLTDCYTRPEFRRGGVGSELIARVKEWAMTQDLELLLVWPSDDSRSFYERAGFGPADGVAMFTLRSY